MKLLLATSYKQKDTHQGHDEERSTYVVGDTIDMAGGDR